MKIPKPDKELQELFRSLVPKDDRVTVKLVFGNDAAFVNGNMFFGVYGDRMYARLREEDAKELLEVRGAGPFEPMPGRAMKGHVVFPSGWKGSPEKFRPWIKKSLDWSSALPPKKGKR